MSRVPALGGTLDTEAPLTDENREDQAIMAAIANRAWADRLVKHAGPGNHPSGSPQTAHGGGSTATKLKPKTKITWDTFVLDESDDEGRPLTFTDEQKAVIEEAVAEWDEFLPGSLPYEITVQLDLGDYGTAWIVPNPGTIELNVNPDEWADERIAHQLFQLRDDPWRFGMGDHVVQFADHGVALNEFRKGIIMHELGHLAAIHQGWGPENWPDYLLPHFSPTWYENDGILASDPSLPSAYASANKFEYFPEALMDYWANGEDAAPLSVKTYEIMKERLK